MQLKMIRYGMLAGFTFLLTVALLETLAARPGRPRLEGAGFEGEITEQVWQVLAEARRITEEAV